MGVQHHLAGRPGGGGWWNVGGVACCVAAYQPKGVASLAASLVDLSGNGNNASDPGGAATPGWDAIDGWDFTLGDDYLTTSVSPAGDQTWSMIVRYSDYDWQTWGTDVALCGIRAANRFVFNLQTAGVASNIRYYNIDLCQETVGLGVTGGVLCVAGRDAYRDGNYKGTCPEDSDISGNIFIGCNNFYGDPLHFSKFKCQAFAVYSCTLTAQQVSDISTAMAAL